MSIEFRANEYMADVLSGKQPACHWIQAAVRRHQMDLDNGPERGLYFDEQAARRVIAFFSLLRHSKGEWSGRPVTLEPWQQFHLWVLFGWMREDGTRRFRTSYLEVARKNGKALALDTPLPTPTGWTTMIDIREGDTLFDDQGQQCRVVAVTPVMRGHECYRVVFSDETSIVADADHLWQVKSRRSGRPHGRQLKGQKKVEWSNAPEYQVLETRQMRDSLIVDCPSNTSRGRKEWNYRVEVAAPLDIAPVQFPLSPYVLGFWLGDGESASARITCAESDLEIIHEIEADGVPVSRRKSPGRAPLFILSNGDRAQKSRDASIQAILRWMGVLGNKHIPCMYLRGSYLQRLALMQGLMDSDGYVSKTGQCEFTTTSKPLAYGFLELARSLGLKPLIAIGKATLYGREISDKYRIQFWAFSDTPVFRLKRKLGRLRPASGKKTRAGNRQIVAIEPVDSVLVRCIQVDSPSSLYLAGEAMIPTHNTTMAAGLGLYLLAADNEPGAEIYSAATKRDQARISHAEATRMVKASPQLRREINVFRDNLHIEGTASKFEPLGADSNTMDGLNVHAAIIDEVHAHKNRETWDVLETATGSRRQPLMYAITTAGYDRETLCWQLHEYATKVLDGIIVDDSFFGMIFGLDEGDDWQDERTWIKANPNLGVSKKLDDMQRKAGRAKEMPASLNAFLRLELDVWTQASTRWVNLDRWQACGAAVDAAGLRGRACYAGLDLSSNIDISALVYVFPPSQPGEAFAVLPRFFIPEAAMIKRSHDDRVPYDAWVRQGYIEATPGDVIDYDFILAQLDQDARDYDVREIAFDRWGATKIIQAIEEHGMVCVQFGQGFASMSPPMKELETLILGGRLAHGNNPVLNWMADNLVARQDPAGNIKPDKEASREKIDGMVALIMGLDRATRHQEAGSVYEERGVLMI